MSSLICDAHATQEYCLVGGYAGELIVGIYACKLVPGIDVDSCEQHTVRIEADAIRLPFCVDPVLAYAIERVLHGCIHECCGDCHSILFEYYAFGGDNVPPVIIAV